MILSVFDLVFFVGFFVVAIGFSLWKSRGGGDSSDYFLGGRSLPWRLIGISIVAANIFTEQMVGMAVQGVWVLGIVAARYTVWGGLKAVA